MKRLRITVEGKHYEVEVEFLDEDAQLPIGNAVSSDSVQSSSSETTMVANVKKPAPATPSGEGDVVSPLAAIVVAVEVSVGDPVKEGQKVITLEAMKMNTTVSAPVDSTVKAIHVSVGDSVEEGQPLIKLD